MTPEGKVKAKIKKLLDRYAPEVYYHMPVQNGMGAPTLDFVGCAWGRYFTIEAKAPGKEPTGRQQATIQRVRLAGAEVFVIDSEDGPDMEQLRFWLDTFKQRFK